MRKEKRIIHCSYHKCLTKYFAQIFQRMYNNKYIFQTNYKHFNSMKDEFESSLPDLKCLSVNNHFIDIDKLNEQYDVKASRFLRDPRDLLISGYNYHKKGAEPWCHVKSPKNEDWKIVNGNVPQGLKEGESYTEYLNRVGLVEGMLAELEFRKFHFESMRGWSGLTSEVKVIKYEDLLGNEVETFNQLFDFYELNGIRRRIGSYVADKLSASKIQGGDKHLSHHMRDPSIYQWRENLPNEVLEAFSGQYADIIETLGYES